MKKNITGIILIQAATLLGLTACTQAGISDLLPQARSEADLAKNYVAMEDFSYELAQFVGLTENESFEDAEAKISTVFRPYDGHTAPTEIHVDRQPVEAGWTQVVCTQDCLLDDTVTGQQLLAVFDEEDQLISYGMRIKCANATEWQTSACE